MSVLIIDFSLKGKSMMQAVLRDIIPNSTIRSREGACKDLFIEPLQEKRKNQDHIAFVINLPV